MKARSLLCCAFLAAMPALAVSPPPKMMANVYSLTEAAAILTVCIEGPTFKALPAEKAGRFTAMVARLGNLVRGIAAYYRDEGLPVTFERTKARIAGEAQMQNYVASKYQGCSERLALDMEAYVAENEKLINAYLAGDAAPKAKPR